MDSTETTTTAGEAYRFGVSPILPLALYAKIHMHRLAPPRSALQMPACAHACVVRYDSIRSIGVSNVAVFLLNHQTFGVQVSREIIKIDYTGISQHHRRAAIISAARSISFTVAIFFRSRSAVKPIPAPDVRQLFLFVPGNPPA